MKNRYYLGKLGQVHGPFSQEQFDQMLTSGKINDFSWLWDFSAKSWKPLDPAPPALEENQTQPVAPVAAISPLKRVREIKPVLGVHAICHNQKSAVSGELFNLSSGGCEFLASEANPEFSPGENASVYLHLYESQSGKAIQVKAKISQVVPTSLGWRYLFSWQQLPALFMQNA